MHMMDRRSFLRNSAVVAAALGGAAALAGCAPETATHTVLRVGSTTDIDSLIKDLSELKIGDPVVHVNHGIGRYVGLMNIDLGDGPSEFLHLEYADKATLYVPVAQLHLIARYTGVSPEEAPLHKLGSGQWDKARRKAAEQVRDTAAELLNLYARRAAREGHAFRFTPQPVGQLVGNIIIAIHMGRKGLHCDSFCRNRRLDLS